MCRILAKKPLVKLPKFTIDMTAEKKLIVEKVNAQLHEQLQLVESQLNSLSEDLQNETKSSMGDKYETGRAQIHLEIDKLKQRQAHYLNQIQSMNSIDFTQKYSQVKNGALVYTDVFMYLISIGLGQIKMEHKEVFVISLESPIGKEMKGKSCKNCFKFQEKVYTIEKIE